MKCNICPRKCNADRDKGEIGYCKQSNEITIARAALHMWEEPCISGDNGSGAVFFSGCNMGCVYCQNNDISHNGTGEKITIERLAEIFLELQEKKANNINLVTPTHFVPQIINAIEIGKRQGLQIPLVYNTSGYENVETIKMLEGNIDVYLPDFKYMNEKIAVKYSSAFNYSKIATSAIDEMLRQTGTAEFDIENIIKKGVIVRHLQLPGQLLDSKAVISHLYKRYKDSIYISIMSQYTPVKSLDITKYPELSEKIKRKNYNKLVDYAIDIGVKNAFIQEGNVSKESFIPQFDSTGIYKY